MEVCPAFIDETGVLSGSIKEQPIYGIGMLVVPETKEITDSFYRLHLCSISSVKGCLRATSDMFIYLQLVDLLLGCVQFDFKSQMGYFDPTSKRAQEKLRLVSFLKSKLGMKLGDAFLAKGQSFKRWDTPSVFTVWKGEWGNVEKGAVMTGVHPLSRTT